MVVSYLLVHEANREYSTTLLKLTIFTLHISVVAWTTLSKY